MTVIVITTYEYQGVQAGPKAGPRSQGEGEKGKGEDKKDEVRASWGMGERDKLVEVGKGNGTGDVDGVADADGLAVRRRDWTVR